MYSLTPLRYLRLEGNESYSTKIGAVGAAALAEMLKENKTIHTIR